MRPLRRWRRWSLLATAAAVLAIAAGGATVVVQHEQVQDAEQQTSALTAVLAAPDTRLVSADVRGGGHAATAWSAGRNTAVVVLDNLPPLPADDRTYQLWLMRPDGTALPSRTVDIHQPERRQVLLQGGLRNTTAIALTIEPTGGSKTPTSDPILALELH